MIQFHLRTTATFSNMEISNDSGDRSSSSLSRFESPTEAIRSPSRRTDRCYSDPRVELMICVFIYLSIYLFISCVGNPTPEVTWWQEQRMVDKHSEFRHPEQGVRNVLQLERLSRSDLLTSLSCQAANTQLSLPLTRSVQIELNCKSTILVIFFFYFFFVLFSSYFYSYYDSCRTSLYNQL